MQPELLPAIQRAADEPPGRCRFILSEPANSPSPFPPAPPVSPSPCLPRLVTSGEGVLESMSSQVEGLRDERQVHDRMGVNRP